MKDEKRTKKGTSIDSPNGRNPNLVAGVKMKGLKVLSRAVERDSLTASQRGKFVSMAGYVMGADRQATAQCQEYAIGDNSAYCIAWYEACLHNIAPAVYAYYEDNELNAMNKYIQFALSVTYYKQHPVDVLHAYMKRSMKRQAKSNLSKI